MVNFNKLHHTIPEQLSSNIVQEYPLFVDFLKGYYEWMQKEGGPYYQIRNHLSFLNFEESLEEYTSLLKSEFFKNLPEKVLADKELLIRFSKQFFGTVGTQKAFDFVFKVVFNEPVEISFPRNQMLIPSNGKWVDDESLMYVSDSNNNIESLLFRGIKQIQTKEDGSFTVATANVARLIKRYANNFVFAELYVTDVVGQFSLEYPIEMDNIREWVLPIAQGYKIDSPGINYVNDNIFEYIGSNTFKTSIKVVDLAPVDTRYKTLFTKTDIVVYLNGVVLTDFEYDGKFLTGNFTINDIVEIEYPVYKGFVVVGDTAPGGAVRTIDLIDMPFGITTPRVYTGTTGGSGASVTLLPGTTRKIPGYYRNTDGFLSDRDKLQDSNYYQDFSYVLKSGISVDRYKDIVYSLLHPAGFKMIGEVSIIELINLMIRDNSLDIVKAPRNVTLVQSSADMYSLYGYIDDWKHLLGCGHYKTWHFKDITLEDITERAFKHYNFSDIKIDSIITTGGYFVDGYIAPGYISNISLESQQCVVL